MKRPKQRICVGWREWAALPDLAIDALKVKVDTGALSSALHAIHVRPFREDGRLRVRFEVHPMQRRTDITVTCVADVVDERVVTSSTGHRENRLVIRTPIRVGGQTWAIDITLTNRDSMGFRMLLGRRAMRNHIVVDPAGSYLCGNGKRLKRTLATLTD